MALSFNRRGGVCPPEDINLSICGRIRAGKPCPYKYLAKADIHLTILNERAVEKGYLGIKADFYSKIAFLSAFGYLSFPTKFVFL